MTTTVNLTALAEARAKMTPGEYREWGESDEGVAIKHRDGEGGMFSVALVRSFDKRHENARGIVATHNAADVLIEVARAAKVLAAAQLVSAAARSAHASAFRVMGSTERVAALEDEVDEADAQVRKIGDLYDEALAKVSL